METRHSLNLIHESKPKELRFAQPSEPRKKRVKRASKWLGCCMVLSCGKANDFNHSMASTAKKD